VVVHGEFVHDLFSVFPYELRESLPDHGGDLVVLLAGPDRDERFQELAAYPGRVVVVFGANDRPLGPELCGSDGHEMPANVVAVYGTNVELADRRAIALPVGVPTSKLRQLKFVRQNHSGKRDGLVYGSFATMRLRREKEGLVGPMHRANLAKQLANASWVTLDVFPRRRDGQEELIDYYSQTASHRFTLSPPGLGSDCYRTWESLYLGAIPIVMTNTAMSPFGDLPILSVDDYGELSEEFLEQSWERMSRCSYDLSKLMKSHYLRDFLDSVAALARPTFMCWRSSHFPSERFARAFQSSPHPLRWLPPEPPSPPFTGRRRITDASAWHSRDSLIVAQRDQDTLSLTVRGEASSLGAIEFPLETVRGGRFLLEGDVRSMSAPAIGLKVGVRDREGEIAHTSIDVAEKTALSFEFRARSDRTILFMAVAADLPAASILLSRLSLEANVDPV
jgi:hypothetical protein